MSYGGAKKMVSISAKSVANDLLRCLLRKCLYGPPVPREQLTNAKNAAGAWYFQTWIKARMGE
jgi:hypothetical protein